MGINMSTLEDCLAISPKLKYVNIFCSNNSTPTNRWTEICTHVHQDTCKNAHRFKKANTRASLLHNFKIHLSLPLLPQVVSRRLWLLVGEISNAVSRTCTTYIWLPATQTLCLGIPSKLSRMHNLEEEKLYWWDHPWPTGGRSQRAMDECFHCCSPWWVVLKCIAYSPSEDPDRIEHEPTMVVVNLETHPEGPPFFHFTLPGLHTNSQENHSQMKFSQVNLCLRLSFWGNLG